MATNDHRNVHRDVHRDEAHSLSGEWHGYYTYRDQSESESRHPFEVVFVEQDGAVTGNMLDLGYPGESQLEGNFYFPYLYFTKRYFDKLQQPVIYNGEMSDCGQELTGSWRIIETYSTLAKEGAWHARKTQSHI